MVPVRLIDHEFVRLTPIQSNIMKMLEKRGPLARRELVTLLETPRTTVYDNLLKLQKRKIIEKFTKNNCTRGRPLVLWTLKDNGGKKT